MLALNDVGKSFQTLAPYLLKDLRPFWVTFTFSLTNISKMISNDIWNQPEVMNTVW